MLTLLSYVFYGWANPLFVVLMFTSTVIDYICGLFISNQFGNPFGRGRGDVQLLEENGPRSRAQKWGVFISILSNLTLLGFFKYFNFGVDGYDSLVSALGLESLRLDVAIRITLPLGISFYTFQSMSYSVDVYRGHARAIRNFIDFACYVSMFPQLVAGPIIRFSEVADQLRTRTHTLTKFARGTVFFCMGTAKKILIANPCGKIADTAFDSGALSVLDSWYGVVAYAFQIYFDFSAYSDMAIGLGLMLGFVFPKNFDSPYHSQSITEFWRRWHISLSSWLRDYLYIPLGGNRKSEVRTYVNLALVMLLGGMWHGASVNFIVWGAIHGGMLGFERLRGKKSYYAVLPGFVRVVITFVLVLFSWVFFRASDLPSAWNYCKTMLGVGGDHGAMFLIDTLIYNPYYLGTFILAGVVTWRAPQTWDWTRTITPLKAVIALALFVLSIAVLTTQSYNPFIYFQF